MTEVLVRALELAEAIWQSEDKSVEYRPGYDVSVTVQAAVEFAGAIQALDTLIRSGYALPEPWRERRTATADTGRAPASAVFPSGTLPSRRSAGDADGPSSD